ncbi:MAG: hypothetical protein O9328_10445 [Rhodobacteraceae bacterium]|nr:hypothetical protein [Paracoccaceae bacterium]
MTGDSMLNLRRVALVCGLALLSACGASDLEEPPVPLGDFALGLNIVVADNVQKVPISRDASPEEWEEVMKEAVAARFGRYQGGRLYNIGISVDGYALAPPGIPVVAAPKSVLVITANIWDDATQTKLNPEGEQFTIFEGMSGDTVIGSGLTRTKRKQMEVLSYNAVKRVEDWLVKHPEWFPTDGTQPVPLPAEGEAPAAPAAVPTATAAPAATTAPGTPPKPRMVAVPLPPPQQPVPIPGPSLP